MSAETATPPSQSILILGPHRSGTSALARVLNLLGVDLGGEMLAPKFDNQLGYWEHRTVFELHERLLSQAGSGWHEYTPMPLGWRELEPVQAIRRELLAFLESEFQGKALWGVKDPRLCRLLPLWLDVLEELGAQARFVIVVRNPLEVARSLERRDHFSFSKCVLLYMSEMLGAIHHTEGRRRAFVSYARLLEDWRQVVSEVGRELEIDWPSEPSRRAGEIDAFLRPSERHHRHSDEDLRRNPVLPPWGAALYGALEEASRGHSENLAPAFREAYDSFMSAIPLFEPEIAHLRTENARLSARLLTLEGGIAAQELAGLERRTELAERELAKVQRHLTSILSSRFYRSTRRLRHAWYGLTRFRR